MRRGALDPFKLTWILTEQCSLRCGTCHLWATDPASGPSLDEVGHVVAANPQLTWVNLSGGDFDVPTCAVPQIRSEGGQNKF